jgi:peptidoglycan/LPS O-acetylase OafA/YrhL
MDYFKRNNFDLIRLVAAAQVMLFHTMHYMEVPVGGLKTVVAHLPGVPAFFFVSGFLISASWERNSDLRTFCVNRALRIFPALWAVLFFSILTLVLFYDTAILRANIGKLILWSICQVTILQDWIPEFTRGYGIGGMNGSLWTIPVELSFYAFTPIIYWAGKRFARGGVEPILFGTIALSFGLQYSIYGVHDQIPVLAWKLLTKSPLPWVGMFCCGVLAQRHLPTIYPRVAGRAPLFIALYVLTAVLSHYLPVYPLLNGDSNSMGIINYLALCGLILSVAYSWRDFAEQLLQRNDISYGVYIFHIPVINMFVHNGILGWTGFVSALVIAIGLAALSWFCVEKPALGLRHWALYKR